MNFDKDLDECLKTLQSGGIILYPTDTVWGIGCDATNPDAVEKIYRLKQRPGEKAMIVLVADERDILQYVASPDLRVFEYLQQQDKPTTVIYDDALGLAENLPAADGSIAIRICEDEFCRHLIRRFRKPLVSTSANISGAPVPGIYSDIAPAILHGVDYIVQHRQDDDAPNTPSGIIKWNNDGTATIIRP